MSRLGAVGIWVLAGLVMALSGNDPLARMVVVAGAWSALARLRQPGRRLAPLAAGIGIFGLMTVAANGLLSHTGASTLVTLPSWIPLAGGKVTVEAFAYGAEVALGLVGAISVAALLSMAIEPSDLVDGLPSFLARTGAAVGSALNLVPALASSFVAVRDAQRLRGWKPRGPRGLVDVVVPVLLDAIERSTQLAESMEARAFGSGARTRYANRSASAGATLAGAAALVALAGFVAAHVAARAGAWYPYPTLSVPAFGPAVLGPPLLLAAAALAIPPAPEQPGGGRR
ncbi:MAG: energy-coupling factor transporter transmembrane component T family protein [Acidimicrobiales bacterium]